MFSIIIPTMWLSNLFIDAIEEYLKSSLVREVIIIDNDPQSRLNIKSDNRIILLETESNIYVNPAWNLGVSISKTNNILLINDDILIRNFNSILYEILKHDFDLIGLNLSEINSGKGTIIKEKKDYMSHGFGCFMFLKKEKYVKIPNELKVWYGDRFLFEKNKNIGQISFDDCTIEISKTVGSSDTIRSIINQDRINYKKYRRNI